MDAPDTSATDIFAQLRVALNVCVITQSCRVPWTDACVRGGCCPTEVSSVQSGESLRNYAKISPDSPQFFQRHSRSDTSQADGLLDGLLTDGVPGAGRLPPGPGDLDGDGAGRTTLVDWTLVTFMPTVWVLARCRTWGFLW